MQSDDVGKPDGEGEGRPEGPEGGNPIGDYFLLVDARGLYWTGEEWSPMRGNALRYQREPDPYGEAREAARAHADRSAMVLYVAGDVTRKSTD